MAGYLQAGDGRLAEFKISWCNENTAIANVHLTQSQITEATGAIINPFHYWQSLLLEMHTPPQS